MRLAVLILFFAPIVAAEPGASRLTCTGNEIARENLLPETLPEALRNALRIVDIKTVGDLEERGLVQVERDLRTSLVEAFRLREVLRGVKVDIPLSERQAIINQVSKIPAKELQNRPLSEIPINPRARVPLERKDWLTLGELAGKSRSDILILRGYGPFRLFELEEWLELAGLPELAPPTQTEDVAAYQAAVEQRRKLRLSIADLVDPAHFSPLYRSGVRNGHQLINLSVTEVIDRLGEVEWRVVHQKLAAQGIPTAWVAEFAYHPMIVQRRRIKELPLAERRLQSVMVLDTAIRARDFLRRKKILTLGELEGWTRRSLEAAGLKAADTERLIQAAEAVGLLLGDE